MKKPKPSFKKLFLLCAPVALIAIIIGSCKKDNNHSVTVPAAQLPAVADAKSWYENAYPADVKLVVQAASINSDWSQGIKPDWNNSALYTRFDDDVVEMPIDAELSGKLNIGLQEQTTGTEFKAANSKSSFLLIKTLGAYHAYIMTIIGDPAYLKGDLTKLNNNKYNKRDSDFAGVVLYSTPKGKFVNAWTYTSGEISGQISPDSTSAGSANTGKEQTDAIKTNLTSTTTCYTWTQTSSYNGQTTGTVVLEHHCVTTFSGSFDSGSGGIGGGSIPVAGTGGGGGGGTTTTPTPPPIPCVPTSALDNIDKIKVNSVTVNKVQPLPGDPGSGFPPPTGKVPCATITTSAFTIKTDSLKKNFPCAVTLIINNLSQCGAYTDLVAPFLTSKRPDIEWKDAPLTWATASNSYMLGQTAVSKDPNSIDRSATITLNTSMLRNSSQLLIAAAAIHETLHAYIHYKIVTQTQFTPPQDYDTNKSWLSSLDAYIWMFGLPSNFRDHWSMLDEYFDKTVDALKTWDGGVHTDKEYAMAMLFGMDNGTDLLPMQGALSDEYNRIIAKKGITKADLNKFWPTQLNAATNNKLPGGCK